MIRIWIIFVLASFVVASQVSLSTVELPRCHISDPYCDHCLAEAIEKSSQLISFNGIPSINFPPIEPIWIDKLRIPGSALVDLVQVYDDIKIYGFSSQKVKRAHFDFQHKILTFTSKLDTMIHKSKYEFNGKVLSLPLVGKGHAIMEFKQPTIDHVLCFREEIRDGNLYFKLISYDITMEPKDFYIHFDNLFDGDKNLGNFMNKFINQNVELLFGSVKQLMEVAYAGAFQKVIEKLFDAVPINELFLP